MLLQFLVQLRMVADIGQQRLTRLSLKSKVAIEVAGQLHSGVILKVTI